ncbi:MAG: ABC transporter ATP-binding protein [Chloroflexi bacterium]|nr:ABC transporter ATP-binding protein [Chloroflexota bacterium]
MKDTVAGAEPATPAALGASRSRESAVEVVDLTRIYGDGLGVKALDGVCLGVRSGEFIAIMGPSGSGKSTLLHLLGALDRPTAGRIAVAGRDLATVRDLDAFRARTVGLVFQLHNLIPTLTALENVEVPMYEGPFAGQARRERARQLLAWVGLAGRLDHRPGQLSGGERQRVAVARALANRPSVILADEPTGSLDSSSGAEVLRLLRDLNRAEGTTVILVTHDPLIALATDRIVTLRDGRVQRDQPVADADRHDLEVFRRSDVGRLIFGEDALTPTPLPAGPDQERQQGVRASPAGRGVGGEGVSRGRTGG